MPLQRLDLTGTTVSDLSPLRGMPLTNLKMTSCKNISDLTPVAEIKTLQTVVLPPNATKVEVLRGLPQLKRIGFKYDSTIKGPDKTAAEFWADYDQAKKP